MHTVYSLSSINIVVKKVFQNNTLSIRLRIARFGGFRSRIFDVQKEQRRVYNSSRMSRKMADIP